MTNSFEEKIPRIYLTLALAFGVILSLAMPFFNEPDGQYHFMVSSAMTNHTVDISRYGETAVGTGMDNQKESYQKGTRFEKYYLTKATIMSPLQSPRNLDLDNKLSYKYLGHIVPAMGIWVGHRVYSSLGVMITFGRLLSMVVYSLAMYFIIKKLKFGQLLFMLVSLSPVVVNQFASLSYDALGYVVVAAIVALAMNTLINRRIDKVSLLQMLFLGASSFVLVKPNLLLANLLFPGVIFYVKWMENTHGVRGLSKLKAYMEEKGLFSPKCKIIAMSAIALLGFSVATYVTSPKGGIFEVVSRIWMSMTFQFNNTMSAGSDMGLLVSPYAGFNYMPVWLLGLWFVMVALVLLADKNEHDSNFISVISLIVATLGVLSVYYGFLFYGSINPSFGLRFGIQGVQGRYSTPFLLIIPLIVSNKNLKLKRIGYNRTVFFVVIGIILSNFLLVFNTLWAMIYV
ncbi:DUF2142 domain-containing protein [Lactococcus garvieae]|uniref:DUF2142 domain-containing protein n=1 Tax=Lactococcus garvieae TaxID=1363 RepID=UPI00254C0E5D|nr:DUF2142 domain-containing protein [Lactococcus garvieae]